MQGACFFSFVFSNQAIHHWQSTGIITILITTSSLRKKEYKMAAVETNSHTSHLGTFKTTDIPTEYMEGLSVEEMEAIVNLASDGTLWNSMEDFECAKADAAGKKAKAIGDWSCITLKPKDPYVIDIGKFAVTVHSQDIGRNLVFLQVFSGLLLKVQPFDFYALHIQFKDGQTIHHSNVLVFEAPGGYKKLLYWKI